MSVLDKNASGRETHEIDLSFQTALMKWNTKSPYSWKPWVCAAVVLLAFFFRVHGLGAESLWLDEGITVQQVRSSFREMMATLMYGDVQPPLYYLILKLWTVLFGTSEIAVRFPSVVFGTLSVWMVYRVARLCFEDEHVGLLTALIVAFSEFHIRYSQEARNYSLLALLSLCSYYYYVKLLRERTRGILVRYILFSSLLMYTHVYGSFIVISQNIYFLARRLAKNDPHRLSWKHWALSQGTLGFLFLPWFVVWALYLLSVGRKIDLFHMPGPTLLTILNTFGVYSGSAPLLLLCALLVPFTFVTHESQKSEAGFHWTSVKNFMGRLSSSSGPDRNGMLFAWLLTPIVLPFLISQVLTPFYGFRYTIGASFAFYLLVAAGMRNLRDNRLILTTVVCFCVLSSQSILGYYTQSNKEQWRAVAGFVDAQAKPGDLLLFDAGYTLPAVFDYYSKRTDTIKRAVPSDLDTEALRELALLAEEHNRVWLILSHSSDTERLVEKALLQTYRLVCRRKYYSVSHTGHSKYVGVELLLFEKP